MYPGCVSCWRQESVWMLVMAQRVITKHFIGLLAMGMLTLLSFFVVRIKVEFYSVLSELSTLWFPYQLSLKNWYSSTPLSPIPAQSHPSFCLILAFKDFVFSGSPLWNFQNPPWGGYGYNYSGTTHYYCHSDCVPNWTEEDHSHFVLKIDKTPRLMLCTIQSLSWLKSYIHVQCKILAVRSHRIWPKIL